MSRNMEFKVKNVFTLRRIKADTGEVVEETGLCPNLITSLGLDFLMGRYGIRINCGFVVGSGNKIAELSDTTLQSYIAGTQNIIQVTQELNTTSPPYYHKKTRRARFAQGAAAGNISEVGIAMQNSGNVDGSSPLFCRARVVDSNGDPTTITILSDEFLDVIHDQYLMAPADLTGTVNLTLDGVATEHAYVVRAARMELNAWQDGNQSNLIALYPFVNPSFSGTCRVYEGTLGTHTTDPSGAAGSCDLMAAATYTNGSHSRNYSVGCSLSVGNFAGGVRTMFLALNAAFVQVQYTPAIPKVSTKQLMLDFNVTVANA